MYSHGTCQCSWGGVKESGIGRAHSKFGFYECVNIKHVAWEPSKLKNFWWHPYDESLGQGAARLRPPALRARRDKIAALQGSAGALAKLGRKTLAGRAASYHGRAASYHGRGASYHSQ